LAVGALRARHAPRRPQETLNAYEGLRLSASYVDANLHMFKDSFSLPEICARAGRRSLFAQL
jgi:hypothetical protein